MCATGPISLIQPFEVWRRPGMRVAGQWYHRREIAAAVCGVSGREVSKRVFLVHVTDNAHDPNAVEVRADVGVLGFLPRQEARRYAPALARLQAGGHVAQSVAWIWARTRTGDSAGFRSRVTVELPEPHLLAPLNAPPRGQFDLLPAGTTLVVSQRTPFAAGYLTRYLKTAIECQLYATLRVTRPGASPWIEVRIDDQPVGQVEVEQPGSFVALLDQRARLGRVVAARALVRDTPLGPQVTVSVPRPAELPSRWLTANEATARGERRSRRTLGETLAATLPRAAAAQAAWPGGEPPAPAPGASWYPDPTHVSRLRYFDGETWTYATAP